MTRQKIPGRASNNRHRAQTRCFCIEHCLMQDEDAEQFRDFICNPYQLVVHGWHVLPLGYDGQILRGSASKPAQTAAEVDDLFNSGFCGIGIVTRSPIPGKWTTFAIDFHVMANEEPDPYTAEYDLDIAVELDNLVDRGYGGMPPTIMPS